MGTTRRVDAACFILPCPSDKTGTLPASIPDPASPGPGHPSREPDDLFKHGQDHRRRRYRAGEGDEGVPSRRLEATLEASCLDKKPKPGPRFLNRGGLAAATEEVLKRPWFSKSNIGDIPLFSPLTCSGTDELPEQLA